MTEEIAGGGGASGSVQEAQQSVAGPSEDVVCDRKERRKAAKKEKRKQKRKELAAKEREEEEARLNDPEELRRIQLEEERENERLERERKEFEEHERLFLEALAAKRKAEEEEEERRKVLEEESKSNQVGQEDENDDDDWEYIEEGPPEIIWQGNEIIVKKKRVRVKRKDASQQINKEDLNRPTSNPLPPQSEAFADYKNGPVVSAQQLLENAAQQIPNFGTEQDKAHCPFHLKTGACRFGSRCSRVHFYPDKSCTLLIKNMYNGPGLAWEQDEGLEFMDEEVERCYEEFYEDVHAEFLKFGEIVNFKVCKNGSFHLRGNVYVHYKSLDSAVLAYQSLNGRYFAGKQIKCEFIGVTKWKVAICGEYMKLRLKTCSRGTACNFIHCFCNPGGDYEWADWDKPPPKYWAKKMAALFGYSEASGYDNQMEQGGRNASKMMTADLDRYYSRRSQSRERDYSGSRYEEYDARRSRHRERHTSNSRKATEVPDKKNCEGISKSRMHDSDSDGDGSNKDRGQDTHHINTRKNTKNQIRVLETRDRSVEDNIHRSDSDGHWLDMDRDRHHGCTRESSIHRKKVYGVPDDYDSKNRTNGTDSRDSSSARVNQNKVPVSPDNSRDSRDRNRDSDSREEDRDRHHRHTRKHSRHSNEGLGFSDEHGNSAKKLKGKYYNLESDLEKLEPQRAEKRHQSSRGDRSSMEPSEANFSADVLKSERYHETTSSSLHSERTKPQDIDYPKSGEKFSLKHQKSLGESSSDESYESDDARRYRERNKSHDSRCFSYEEVDGRGRWESDKIGPEKHHPSRRKFSSRDFDRYAGNSNSRDKNSDKCDNGNRLRGSGRSSSWKSSGGSEEVDSAEECQEPIEIQKKDHRRLPTHGHKRHHKKSSS